MEFSDELLRELLATFAVEAEEHLQTLTRDLLALEKGPGAEKSAELLAEIFRAAHSLKGAARAVNLGAAGEVSHHLETLFARLRDGELAASPALFDLIYQALDALGVLVQPNPSGPADAAPSVDVAALCARLEAAHSAGAPPAPAPARAPKGSLAQRMQKSARPVAAAPPAEDRPRAWQAPTPEALETAAPSESSPAQPAEAARTAMMATEPAGDESSVATTEAAQTAMMATEPGGGESSVATTEAAQTAMMATEPAGGESSVATTEAAEPMEEASPAPAPPPAAPVALVVPAAALAAAVTPVAASEPARARPVETTVRLSTSKLDALMEVVGELQAARLSAELRQTELHSLLSSAESLEALSRAVRQHTRRLRLDSAEAESREAAGDGLEAAAKRLAEAKTQAEAGVSAADETDARRRLAEVGAILDFVETNDVRVRELRGRLSDLRRQFEADGRHLAQLMADLQDGVRRTRLVPIATVLDTFPRVVRDLARQLNKDVDLEISGGETEVDRAMLEQIKDPLSHLVRNSLDHGLEKRAARLAAGKPATGKLTLSAAQHGDSLRLELADDGGGIDVSAVKAGAVARGLVTAEAAAAMSDHEALWLIFRSGLSTSATITAISGRGVGLDVVRENIERMNGWIEVNSVPGRGTRFAFSLPLTVATTLCLMAQAGGQTFGLPLSSVVRVVRVGADEIGHAEAGEAIRVDGRPIALLQLSDVLNLAPGPAAPARAGARRPAVVVGSAERRAAFLVDTLGAAQEVVVKSLPRPFERVRHVSGAAILGSGEVALILNAADLLRGGKGASPSAGAAESAAESAAGAPAEAVMILVADDSITTRTLEKNILEAAGYTVRVAADGQEAWTILQSEPCRLLVSDVNMPRLDGFELTEKVRGHETLKRLPIVLVTSLDSREDRERGIWAGADAYIVKGSFDQDVLLSTIRQLI